MKYLRITREILHNLNSIFTGNKSGLRLAGKPYNATFCSSSSESMPEKFEYEHLMVVEHGLVTNVQLNRPGKRNAMDGKMWSEIADCFQKLHKTESRAVVLSGNGKAFCAGIDVGDLQKLAMNMESDDPGRRAFQIRDFVRSYQQAFTVIDKLEKPVIAAVHGACVGGAIDMISSCDIRYCSKDAYFQIKEVDLGIAADVGTLQRLPKLVGNSSLLRELVYTARSLSSDEALTLQLVSHISSDKDTCLEDALKLAEVIAEKSPVAVRGSKVNLNYARDHSVDDSLDYIATWNMSMLQSEDVVNAGMAMISKTKPTFSKL